jgi:hypothetical protein
MNLDTRFTDLGAGVSHRQAEGDFVFFSPISDNRVSRFEQEEEGQILGAAKWLAVCLLFVVAAAGSAMWGLS